MNSLFGTMSALLIYLSETSPLTFIEPADDGDGPGANEHTPLLGPGARGVSSSETELAERLRATRLQHDDCLLPPESIQMALARLPDHCSHSECCAHEVYPL